MTCWMYRVDGGPWMSWGAACEQVGCKLNHFDGRDSCTTKSGHVVERAEQPRELAALTSAAARGVQVAVLDGEVVSFTRAATECGCNGGSRSKMRLEACGVLLMTPQEALGWLGVRREAVRRGVDVTPEGYLAARARWDQSRSKGAF